MRFSRPLRGLRRQFDQLPNAEGPGYLHAVRFTDEAARPARFWRWTAGYCLVLGLVLLAPLVTATGQVGSPAPLSSRELTLSKEAEVELEIEARSLGASWAIKGAEAAALLLEVDGQYNQDLILWAGDSPFVYRVLLGRLAAGRHQISVKMNPARSAAGAQKAAVLSLRAMPLTAGSRRTADDLLALANAPVLYQRANTIDRFSDLPLLMYYEILHPAERETLIRYTVIFTNEDGGTPTAALMARWGRAADIEWVYEFRFAGGRIVEERYQAVAHETKPFNGERINGHHPVLTVASDNNNFSDQTRSSVRFAMLPVAADLRNATRESVMDANPWTYRAVAEELRREGKVKAEPADLNTIADPRNYLYIDLGAAQNGTAIGVEATTAKQPVPSSSDLGEPRLRIDRSGYFRTAVRLASVESAASVLSLTVRCHSAAGHVCERVEVRSAAMLDQNYNPRFLQIQRLAPRTLKPNEYLTVSVGQEATPKSRQ